MSELQDRIMRRVRIIHAAKRLASPVFLKIYAIAFLFLGVVREISLGSVIQNIPKDPALQVNFLTGAFLGADTAVKLVTIAGAFLFLWLAKDILSNLFTPGRALMRQEVR